MRASLHSQHGQEKRLSFKPLPVLLMRLWLMLGILPGTIISGETATVVCLLVPPNRSQHHPRI